MGVILKNYNAFINIFTFPVETVTLEWTLSMALLNQNTWFKNKKQNKNLIFDYLVCNMYFDVKIDDE